MPVVIPDEEYRSATTDRFQHAGKDPKLASLCIDLHGVHIQLYRIASEKPCLECFEPYALPVALQSLYDPWLVELAKFQGRFL